MPMTSTGASAKQNGVMFNAQGPLKNERVNLPALLGSLPVITLLHSAILALLLLKAVSHSSEG
jgi:hypothetical protein